MVFISRFARPVLSLAAVAFTAKASFAAAISGSVADAAGHPVAGATVTAEPANSDDQLYRDHKGEQTCLTDASGRFQLNFPADDEAARTGPVFASLVYARIAAAGFGLTDAFLQWGENRIVLSPPFTATGTVVDGSGRPLAGVHLRYAGSTDEALTGWSPEESDVVCISDAQGNWQLAGLPAGAPAFVQLDDPRYVDREDECAAGMPLKLVARPAATIRGTLIAPDGSPVAGVWIRNGAFPGTARNLRRVRTGNDGSFALTGLPAGSYNLVAVDPQKQWQASPLWVDTVPEGSTITLRAWKARPWTQVSVRILAAATGRPLSGVRVTMSSQLGNSLVDESANANTVGSVTLGAVTGWVTVRAEDPNRHCLTNSRDFFLTEDTVSSDLGDLTLSPGATITGTVHTSDGDPAAGLCLQGMSFAGDGSVFSQTEAKGDFALGPFTPGSQVQFMAYGPGRWQILSPPPPTKCPETGGNPAPVHLIVRRIDAAPAYVRLKGRVVDEGGHPLAGVAVDLVEPESVADAGEKTLITGPDGVFASGNVENEGETSITNLLLSGYAPQSIGTLPSDGKSLVFTDSVMAKRDGTYSGQVVDQNGQPVPGAWIEPLKVMPTANDPDTGDAFPKTDADGRFQFDNFPEGEITFLAAHGDQFGEAKLQNGVGGRIQLLSPVPLPDSAKWAFIAGFPAKDYVYLEHLWEYLGADKMLDLALRIDGVIAPDGARHDGRAGEATTEWFGYLAAHDPARAAAIGPDLLACYDPHSKMSGARDAIAGACARFPNPRGRAFALSWLRGQPAPQFAPYLTLGRDETARRFQMAGVAAALGLPEAASYLDVAIKAAQQDTNDFNASLPTDWGPSLALAGEAEVERVMPRLSAPQRFFLWAGAVPLLAEESPASGNRAMTRVLELQKTPEFLAWEDGQKQINWPVDSATTSALYSASFGLQLAKARSEDKSVFTDFTRQDIAGPVCDELARAALARHDPDTAREALRAGVDANTFPYVASLAHGFDPSLSAQVFDSEPVIEWVKRGDSQLESTAPAFAFYHEFQDLGESRLLLEIVRRAITSRPKERSLSLPLTDPTFNQAQLLEVAGALFPLDPVQSLEIFKAAPDDNHFKPMLEANVLALMETDPSRWATIEPWDME